MRKVLKWVGIIIGVLLVVIILAAVALYILGSNNLDKSYNNIPVETVMIPTDDESLARGQHIAEAVSLCSECHGMDLSGDEFIDDALFGSGDAPNLTSGAGGIGAAYTDEDWVRAIRHGVKPNGDAIKFMPSNKYYTMSDDDLGALIAYVKSVPPVDNEPKTIKMAFVGTIMLGNMLDLPAEQIDHNAERPVAPEVGVTVEYGEYLLTIASCQDCHGKKLDGKSEIPGFSAPNLINVGNEWTEEQFISTLRQGINPEGDVLDTEEMPWDYYTRMTDDELSAIWLYIASLE